MNGIRDLAAKGRNGDNTLMHVSNDEVAGLNALARSTMGRELTTNPDTGLPEAFMFAPFLAPMVAGGLGAGGSALATGALAGGLGAAEAEIRGMDDPLRRGLFAGLTAGAASGLGNALSAAAPGAETAATTSAAGGPEISQAVTTPGPSLGNMQSVPQQSFPGSNFTPPPTPTEATASLGLNAPAPAELTQPATTGSMTLDPRQAFQQSQYAEAPSMLEGAKNIFRDEAARGQFMQQARIPAAAGFVGLGGQAQMGMQDDLKSQQEASDREKAAELKEAQDRIRANYASVGRPMPTGFGGAPLFSDGGIVNLRRGGRVGGPGGGSDPGNMGGGRRGPDRGARGRSMSGGGGSGPRSGRTGPVGRASDRDAISSANELGMRQGGGGGSAAVQQPRQLDPAKLRAAVISPMDEFRIGIGKLAQMSPTVRMLQHLTRDRRGLKGASPHGPGAPLTRSEQGLPPIERNTGGGGNNRPARISQSAPEPTVPLTPQPAPMPTADPFLLQLQQGAGNRQAMQNTGYTGMAQGGYLDGGMLPGDGMSDDVPATIDGDQPAALSSGEFVIPADVVSHIGNGSSDAGAKELYAMMDRIREARTGTDEQAPEINTRKMMPK